MLLQPRRGFERANVIMHARNASAQGSHLRHPRRLRHPDRLGVGRLRRVRQGGRQGRLHALARGARAALPGDPAGDQGRLLRALRRGAAPHGRADLAAARVAAGAVAVRLPAGFGQALAAVQGDQHAARPLPPEVRARADLQHRRQAAGRDAPVVQDRLRPRGHRAAGALLQARPGALQGGRAAHRLQEGLGARGVVVLLRRRAVHQGQDPGHLGQPPQGAARRVAEEADGRGQDAARGGQAARRGLRAVGLHADVIALTSRAYATGCVLVRSGGEAFCIDSPVFPDELEILPAMAQQAAFDVVGLIATHADWDHVLSRYSFPEASLGMAETSAARLINEPGKAQRELREFDHELYVERPGPLSLGASQRLPVPGQVEIGAGALELQPADGHTPDGMAIWVPWASVLVCGDYLSPVEIPMVEFSVDAYLATLARLEPWVEQAAHVVPGHGGPIDGTRALAILREDRAYLEGLPDAPLPFARRTEAQKRIHAENVARLRR